MSKTEQEELERLQEEMRAVCGVEGALFLRFLMELIYEEHSEGKDEGSGD